MSTKLYALNSHRLINTLNFACDVITNPDDVVGSYDDWYENYVPYYWHRYKSTDELEGSGNCGATAIVNMMIYYYFQGKDLYDGDSWNSANSMIYSIAGDNAWLADEASAVNAYADSKGYSFNASPTWWCRKSTIQSQVDQGIPTILNVMGHSTYGNHYVLVLGYKDYVTYSYEGVNLDEVYFLIADGWSNYPDRYILGDSGLIDNAVYVNP